MNFLNNILFYKRTAACLLRLSLITSVIIGFLFLISVPEPVMSKEDGHGHEPGKHEENPAVELSPESMKMQNIVVETLAMRPVAEIMKTTAEIGFNEQHRVVLTARSSGWADKVAVFSNRQIKKNQLLARIYSPEFLSAQNEYLLIQQRANGKGPAATEAKSLLADARQRLRILGLTLGEINKMAKTGKVYPFQHIHSPITGTVIEHHLNTGDTIKPGQKMYVIASLDTVWADINLTETQLGKVRAGQPVNITVKAYPGKRFNGRIASVGANVDEITRTVKARALIQNPERLLKPGMFADADIAIGRGDPELALPQRAILRSPDGDWMVFVEGKPGHFRPKEIEVERNVGDLSIIKGIPAGTRVVTQGAFFVQSELAKSGFEIHNH